ncbi:porin [Pseudoruegeria sp. HB172150]|uniref:porin n=1 Tax=Pseudoruegeria sp. HB172150 TaxID=2721164 RepID=UPI001C131484|nr:porin [Pseudoruegeria sp. HB172150]
MATNAQDWNNTVTLGVGGGNLSDGNGEVVFYTLDASGDVSYRSGFVLEYDLSLLRAEPGDITGDTDGSMIGLAPRYRFGSGFSAGAYLENATVAATGLSIDTEATSYGLTAGYETGPWSFSAFYGISDTEGALPDGSDVTDYGLGLTYILSDRVTLAANTIQTRADTSGGDGDADLYQFAATYQINQSWGLFGGASFGSVDTPTEDGDISTFGIGGSYYFGDTFKVPLTASLEYARSNLDSSLGDGEMNTVRFGLTIPLSGSGTYLPLNSVAGGVINSRRSAISSGAVSAF